MEPTNLNQAIIEFLNSASSTKTPVTRCDCGAMMEKRRAAFFYNGKSWEVELPICMQCDPSSGVASHGAQLP